LGEKTAIFELMHGKKNSSGKNFFLSNSCRGDSQLLDSMRNIMFFNFIYRNILSQKMVIFHVFQLLKTILPIQNIFFHQFFFRFTINRCMLTVFAKKKFLDPFTFGNFYDQIRLKFKEKNSLNFDLF
jgi:hypothetical protein